VIEPSEALFMGLGKTPVSWYRCVLPATFLEADWVGVRGRPPRFQFVTGLIGQGDERRTDVPKMDDYRVVVVQQPRGREWLRGIKNLQSRGVRVLAEFDDYLHGIRKQKDHDFAESFTREDMRDYELCMRAADGLIVSTDYLGRRYRAFNRNVWVCENGIDLGRYALTIPERETVNIIWVGATGHARALERWLPSVQALMRRRPETRFMTIGMPWADALRPEFGERAISIPWTMIENYPAAMTNGDIVLAPAGRSAWYRGKSQLRFYEAGALGLPIVADPHYSEVEPGVTGFLVDDVAELEEQLELLVADRSLRLEVGAKARDYVRRRRDASVTSQAWMEAFREAVA
jgi:glycosyltransferase involved in cell wall biosynthesis